MFRTHLYKFMFKLGKYLCADMIKKKTIKDNIGVAQ